MYKRVNRQTGEIKTGTFEDLADLDVRVWTRAEWVQVDGKDIPEEPLTVLMVVESITKEFYELPIYSLSDLVGIHLGNRK